MATTFYLIEQNGDFDYQFLTQEQYWQEREATGDRIPCKRLESITVADENAASEWQSAYSDYITAAWTPNQSSEDRAENAPIIAQAQATMKRLEAVAV